MTTRKKGGDIDRNRAYRNILSIGYELETPDITKLTLRSDLDENDKTVEIMMNTDTARKDISKLIEGVDEDSDDYEDILARQEELIEIEARNNSGKIDKNIHFAITNDISETPLTNHIIEVLNGAEDESDYVKDERFELMVGKQKYPIHFINEESQVGFTNVEWICTHYKPQQHRNIILDTFFNTIMNLGKHLYKLTHQPCVLSIKNDKIKQVIITNPKNRMLYHHSNTNMYYLQTHILDETEQNIMDICVTPQMTFSTKIHNAYGIFKALSSDRFVSIESYRKYNDIILVALEKVNKCVDELLESYITPLNIYNGTHNSVPQDVKGEQLPINQLKLNKEQMSELKGYMFLILWKIYIYYNRWLSKSEKYFKNVIIFNVRHLNYDFYTSIKQLLTEHLQIEKKEAVSIILHLFLQPDILKTYMTNQKTKLPSDVFNINNALERENTDYGDPAISLLSYFHFFEQPSHQDNVKSETPTSSSNHSKQSDNEDDDNDNEEDEEDDNEEDDNKGGNSLSQKHNSISQKHSIVRLSTEKQFYSYDWLEYKQLDAYSAKMEYKDKIILVELRHFPKLLISYIYHIADDELKHNLEHGLCSKKKGKGLDKLTSISIRHLVDAYKIYKRTKSSSKTNQKTMKSRKLMASQ
jgi:hypothetical protein